MELLNDAELLAEYAANRSEEAFTRLVGRHVAMVYSAALRQVHEPPLAEEVTQAVFVILARKAGSLRRHNSVAGWLCHTAFFVAHDALKAERRRRHREQLAAQMENVSHEIHVPDEKIWAQLSPLLDEGVAQLGEKDQNAVVLRFYKRQPFEEVGRALGVNADTAQKRVARALEKLRRFFARRGVALSATAIAGAVAGHSVHAAPANLARSVATAKGTAKAVSTLSLVEGTTKLLAWMKVKSAVTVSAGIAVIIVTTAITLKAINSPPNIVQAQVTESVQTHLAAVAPAVDIAAAVGDLPDSVREQVLKIIRTNQWRYLMDDTELRMLIAIGPNILPTLRELLQDPQAEPVMYQRAVQISEELGAVTARPLSSALSNALEDSNLMTSVSAHRAILSWSVSESPKAAAAYAKWLSNPERRYFESDVAGGYSHFSKMPDAVPLLIPWLKSPPESRPNGPFGFAGRIATILGSLGTNAASAIPSLIVVSDHGYDHTEPRLFPRRRPSSTPDDRSRSDALKALGQIGIASPEVVAALRRGLSDTNDTVRAAALASMTALNLKPEKPLADILKTFSPRRGMDFMKIIQSLGSMGTNAHEALPWLRQFTFADYVQGFPEGRDGNLGWDIALPAEKIRLAAMASICRIDHDEARQYLPELLGAVHMEEEVRKFLTESKFMAGEIVAGLEPQLRNPAVRVRAASLILAVQPNHAEALAIVRNAVTEGDWSNRLTCARTLWMATGETKELFDVAVEGLATSPDPPVAGFASVDHAASAAINLGEIAPETPRVIPVLKAALWHNSRFVRNSAGMTLRKIAPEQLPPIQ